MECGRNTTDFRDNSVEEMLNEAWMLNSAFLIFFMQAGFCLFEVGFVRVKSVKEVIIKNIIGIVVGTMLYWAVGYGLAFGRPSIGGLFGSADFFLSETYKYSQTDWIYHWAYCTTATTIVSASMAERTYKHVTVLYSTMISGLIFPLLTHCMFLPTDYIFVQKVLIEFHQGFVSECGWLCQRGIEDTGGAGAVHMAGGCVGLVGAWPRIDWKNKQGHLNEQPHNIAFGTLGAFILWYGFYAYNTASIHSIEPDNIYKASHIAVNVTISATAACATTLVLIKFIHGKDEVLTILNGVSAGIVSITASSVSISAWNAFAIGIVGALIYLALSQCLLKLNIDDPLDSSPVHLGAGAWSLLTVGIFGHKDMTFGVLKGCGGGNGFLYEGGGKQFGVQLLGLVIAVIWPLILSVALFYPLKRYKRLYEVEIQDIGEEQIPMLAVRK